MAVKCDLCAEEIKGKSNSMVNYHVGCYIKRMRPKIDNGKE